MSGFLSNNPNCLANLSEEIEGRSLDPYEDVHLIKKVDDLTIYDYDGQRSITLECGVDGCDLQCDYSKKDRTLTLLSSMGKRLCNEPRLSK